MKVKDLLIKVQTLALNNPEILDADVDVLVPGDSDPYSIVEPQLTYPTEVEDESEGIMLPASGLTLVLG